MNHVFISYCLIATTEQQILSLDTRFTKLEQFRHLGTGRVDHTKFGPYTNHSSPGLKFHVDTTHCQFSSTPIYLMSLTGTSHHWHVVGSSSIYNPTPTGFDVYLDMTNSAATAQQMLDWAATYKWVLEWIGIEDRPSTSN